MAELTKYQQFKMYLPVNGYDTVKQVADEWGVTTQAIRNHCRNRFDSERLEKLIDSFISEGEKKFQEHRSANNLSKCNG